GQGTGIIKKIARNASARRVRLCIWEISKTTTRQKRKSGAGNLSRPQSFPIIERCRLPKLSKKLKRLKAGLTNFGVNIRIGQRMGEFVDLALRLVLRHSVPFLKLADQLIPFATDGGQVIVSELSPLFF